MIYQTAADRFRKIAQYEHPQQVFSQKNSDVYCFGEKLGHQDADCYHIKDGIEERIKNPVKK